MKMKNHKALDWIYWILFHTMKNSMDMMNKID